MSKTSPKGGKKGRKIGRSAKKPSHSRYNIEKRWEENKIKKAKKIKKLIEKKKARKDKKSD